MGGKLFIKKLKFGQFCSRRCFRRASQELIFSSDFYKCTGFLNSESMKINKILDLEQARFQIHDKFK